MCAWLPGGNGCTDGIAHPVTRLPLCCLALCRALIGTFSVLSLPYLAWRQLECMSTELVPFSTRAMSTAAIGAVETASDVILQRQQDRYFPVLWHVMDACAC